ncbi:MAG: AAA family ATPase, partial [Candidatus Spyradenecus sp.]
MALINVQSSEFPLIREKRNIYVDKTSFFYRLIQAGEASASTFFLARPRRFGKSLMISTLKAIFQGKRELFEGLAVAKEDYDWQSWPVIHLDLSQTLAETVEDFLAGFRNEVWQALLDFDDSGEATPPVIRLRNVLKRFIREGKQVVLLIDEYDAPICHTLNRPEFCERIRSELANFYAVLKGNQA